MPTAERLIVCASGDEYDPGRLPVSRFLPRRRIAGGERSMHELAFAAASAGIEVELRGWLDRPTFDQLAEGCGSAPALAAEPREARAGDIVAVASGNESPLIYARPWLSPGHLLVLAYGPLGLGGWPFVAGWTRPAHLGLSPSAVNRPEYFQALAAMGASVWTNAESTVEAGRRAGVTVSLVGYGQPYAFPQPQSRRVDVVWLRDSRWQPRTRAVLSRLSCSVDAVPSAGQRELLDRFGRARIFLYPCGVEGEPRVTREARAMGAVPVVLNDNPLASHLSEAEGVVAVDSPDELAPAVEKLLANSERLAELSDLGMATARRQVAWEPFVARVKAAFDALPEPDPAAGARAVIGAAVIPDTPLRGRLADAEAARGRLVELEAEVTRRGARNEELEVELRAVLERKDELERERVSRQDRLLRGWQAVTGVRLRR